MKPFTGSSSVHASLRCAIAIAEHLGHERPDWELSLGSLAIAVAILAAIQVFAPSLHNVAHNPLQDLLGSRRDAWLFALVVFVAGGLRGRFVAVVLVATRRIVDRLLVLFVVVVVVGVCSGVGERRIDS